jgi:hypothetical protein
MGWMVLVHWDQSLLHLWTTGPFEGGLLLLTSNTENGGGWPNEEDGQMKRKGNEEEGLLAVKRPWKMGKGGVEEDL